MSSDAINWLKVLETFFTLLLGAAATGIPLWYKIRQINLKIADGSIKLRAKEAKQEIESEKAEEALTQEKKINAEAEWKRIIEFRDAELVRLRDRDDQQEKQLLELWNKHIECQRTEAAQGERIKAQDKRIDDQTARINSMEQQLGELLAALIARTNPLTGPK